MLYVVEAACHMRVTKGFMQDFRSPLEVERSIAVPLEDDGDALMPLCAASPEQLHAAANGRLVGLPFIISVLTVCF